MKNTLFVAAKIKFRLITFNETFKKKVSLWEERERKERERERRRDREKERMTA